MSYTLNLGVWNSVFAVPCSLVDRHLKLAGALQLKVLLWCLRHAGDPVSSEEMGQALGASPADVRDAMSYWLESGILTAQEEEFVPPKQPQPVPDLQPAAAQPQECSELPEQEPAKTPRRTKRRPAKPDSVFVTQRISASDEIRYMMEEAQQILGRPLSPGMSSTLLMLYDDYGLPGDVILMLLQYAKSRGRDTTNYIESVGRHWADEGINTHELVEEKLRALDDRAAAWRALTKILGISKRSPSSNEEQYAYRWLKEWAFSENLVREAYERCVDSTGSLSLSYIEKILARWRKEGVATLEQAREETAKKKKEKKAEHQATYNIGEYERTSIDVPEET